MFLLLIQFLTIEKQYELWNFLLETSVSNKDI